MTFLNIKKDVKECHERREKLKLKEFDFDYPYEKNEDYIQSLLDDGYEYLQATKKDYEKNHKASRINFRMQTRCITAVSYTHLTLPTT